MIFRQSALSELTRETITEQAPRMPRDIYPAMVGSGLIGMGFDATGLQGLNTRTRQYRDTISLMYDRTSLQDDLYIRHDSAISKHEVPNVPLWNPPTNFHLMPCGWLDYKVTIAGEVYDSERLAAEASDWSRSFSPRSGLLRTGFVVNNTRITWQTAMAPDAMEADFLFEAKLLDGKPQSIRLDVCCRQTTRAGKPIAAGGMETDVTGDMVFRLWKASTQTSTATVLEPIRLTWALAFHGSAGYESDGESISAHAEASGVHTQFAFRLVSGSDRNGTATAEFARKRVEAFRNASSEDALSAIAASWKSFFEQGADIHIGDPLKEFMLFQAQYHLRAGSGWVNGIPMSTLWTQAITPATYWDSFFASDGMLRCGHFEPVRQLCRWLLKTAMEKGRPHYWMTYPSGVPVETTDEAYQVILAFSGIFIRLYESTRDRRDMEELAYPYLKRVAEYLLDEVLAKDSDGWHLRGNVAHDVDTTTRVAKEQPSMLLWAAVCLSKCAEYGAKLGKDDDVLAGCREVDQWFRAHPIDLSNPGMWGFWIPMLSGAEPLADFDSWWRMAREKLSNTPMNFYNLIAWGNYATSISLSMTGHPDLALQLLDDGLCSISGMGCIDEVCYESHGGGWAPFPTAVGPYLSALLIGFAHGSLWDDELLVCVHLPRRLAVQHFRWSRVATFNGARVSGIYDPDRIEAVVESAIPRPVRLRMPFRIAGEPLSVCVNGNSVEFQEDGETVLVQIPAGEHRITVGRDRTTRTDVVVAEPTDQGRPISAFIREAGLSVRWARDFDSLPRVTTTAHSMLINESYAVVPPDTVAGIEAAVRDGLTLVCLYHAGCVNVDSAMAELTGVRATFDGSEREYWGTASRQESWRLTADAAALLPDLPHEFDVPVCGRFAPNLAEGVVVLATETAKGRPVATLRQFGRGRVAWLATGSRVMDFGSIDAVHRAIKDLWTFGEDIQEKADLKWLRDENVQKFIIGLLKQ